MFVCAPCVHLMPIVARKRFQNPWDWNYRQLWATMRATVKKPKGTWWEQPMALNHWAISQLKVFLTNAMLLRTAWEVKPEELINTYPSSWAPQDFWPFSQSLSQGVCKVLMVGNQSKESEALRPCSWELQSWQQGQCQLKLIRLYRVLAKMNKCAEGKAL